MQWTKPDYQEITLAMEVTAYVNTDEPMVTVHSPVVRKETAAGPSLTAADEHRLTTDH